MIFTCLSIGPGPCVSVLFAEQKATPVPVEGREGSLLRWKGRPTYRLQKSLRLFGVERIPLDSGFRAVTDFLLRRLADVRDEVGQDGHLRLLAECSSYTWGQPLARRIKHIKMMHMGITYSAAMEVVPEEFGGFRPEGWRTRISRRTVASTLAEMSDFDRLKIEVKGPLAAELRSQVAEFTNKPQRAADEPAPPEDLVLGLGLLCVALDSCPQPGTIGDLSYPQDNSPERPMRRSEKLGQYEPEV